MIGKTMRTRSSRRTHRPPVGSPHRFVLNCRRQATPKVDVRPAAGTFLPDQGGPPRETPLRQPLLAEPEPLAVVHEHLEADWPGDVTKTKGPRTGTRQKASPTGAEDGAEDWAEERTWPRSTGTAGRGQAHAKKASPVGSGGLTLAFAFGPSFGSFGPRSLHRQSRMSPGWVNSGILLVSSRRAHDHRRGRSMPLLKVRFTIRSLARRGGSGGVQSGRGRCVSPKRLEVVGGWR